MNPDHPTYADWDAAYLLGALSPAERRLFEAHREECEICRAAIADLVPTIALLSRVDPVRARSLVPEAGGEVGGDAGGDAGGEDQGADEGRDAAARRQLIEAGVAPRLPGRAGSRRVRAAWWLGGVAAAAAVAVAVVLALSTAIAPALRSADGSAESPAESSGGRTAQVLTLEPVLDIPLTATVELASVDWGTRIEMVCRYGADGADGADGGGAGTGEWPYALVVVGDDGTATVVSTWRARPGSTARLSAASALDPDEIAAVEIRAVGGDDPLLRAETAGER